MISGSYHAYGEGVVYEFEWYAKRDKKFPGDCREKTKFSEATFESRIAHLKAKPGDHDMTETSVAGMPAKLLVTTVSPKASFVKKRWLIWEKDRWFELGMTYRKGDAVDEQRFLAGLNTSGIKGIDIGYGADAVLGDAGPESSNDVSDKSGSGFVLVVKPRPGYTEAARESNTQGTVLLKATFLSNGSVGSVVVIKSLPFGLTEQAIRALRSSAFLPQLANGKPINVVKQIEYTFSIY